MPHKPSIHSAAPGIFVTGTDTNVGKTFVSAVLTRGLNATYWKPIQTGYEERGDRLSGTDRSWVRRYTSLPIDHFPAERYLFQAPLSPHIASRMEGTRIDLEA